MNYPNEFFTKRSFEVVSAAFRLAAILSRAGMRQIIEERASAYFLHKDLATLNDLGDAIMLGYQVGDISAVNKEVMMREIGVLQDLLHHAPQAPEQESVRPFFSANLVSFDDFVGGTLSSDDDTHVVADSPEDNLSESGNDSSVSDRDTSIKSDVSDTVIESGKSLANSPEKSGKENMAQNHTYTESGNTLSYVADERTSDTARRKKTPLQAAERREFIVSFLRTKNFCHVNDIIEQLPQVSDRTIRYDIKALVDNKIVERVGNGGPSSYFRLRRSLGVTE